MCFSIPGKIKTIKNQTYTVDYGFEKRKINRSIVKVSKDDWVLVQNKTIVKKIPKKQATEILALISR